MPMSRAEFACIDPTIWRLSNDIGPKWRTVLLDAIAYEQVIEKVASEAQVVELHRNQAEECPGYYRALVTIKVSPKACALFHSGCSGYRAQFYQNTAIGERANRLAVETLLQAIDSQLGETRSMSRAWIQASLSGSATKSWIHQGPWLRYRRRSNRLLAVSRWTKELLSESKGRRKLALWASLVPLDEDRIDIKGVYLTLNGQPLSRTLKEGRSRTIHELGFT